MDTRVQPTNGESCFYLLAIAEKPRPLAYNGLMKTRSIEVDDATAAALTQRATERGVSVPELVAELVTLGAGQVIAEAADITELDRRWRAFETQSSVAANDEVVRWLESWGTPTFRSWRKR
jgi:predicted transcriptional regulator